MTPDIAAATVFLVDDDAAVRDSVSMLLETAGLAVRAYDSAEAFLADLGADASGCLILDMRMQGMGGLDLQSELARREVRLPIIFVSVHSDVPATVRAMKAGAFDFLTKPLDGALLLDRVQAAVARSRKEHDDEQAMRAARARLASLTERERSILALAIAGHPNKEIARQLGISFRTVEVHRSRILLKTRAATLLELAHLWAASGLVPVGAGAYNGSGAANGR
jgi:FixJ family two-component response regulator